MYDYDRNMSYVISEGEPHHQAQPIKNAQKTKAIRNAQLSLLETRWLKPTIIRASAGRIGLRPVDVVETMVEGERVDFAFDQKTHLPVQVSYHDVVKGKTLLSTVSPTTPMSAAFKVPTTQQFTDGGKYTEV